MKTIFKRAYLKLVCVIMVLAIIGFSTVSHYGVGWDEGNEIAMVKYNFELISQGKPIPRDLKYYGAFFNSTAEIVFQAKAFLSKGLFHNPLEDKQINLEDNRAKYQAIYERVQVKHPLVFLMFLLTCVGVAGMVAILAGIDYAWLAPIVMALFPRFWAHSFFNPKDIPVAAMFTLGTFFGSCLVGYYLKIDRKKIKLGTNNQITLYSILYGVLVGLATGTRIAAFLLLLFIVIAHLGARLGRGNIVRDILVFWPFYSLIFLAWAITTTIVYPASWTNPVGWFFDTLSYLSNHGHLTKVLFEGKLIDSKSVPWYYLPKWMFISIPIVLQITFFIGLFWLLYKYKVLNNTQRACTILVLLQIFFLPTVAMLKQSTLYNGMRHFFFVLPGIATISTIALIWIYQALSKKNLQIIATTFIVAIFIGIVREMMVLHPYEQVYFNGVSGGLVQTHGRYDLDYWGLSVREGQEWLNQNVPNSNKIVVGGYIGGSQMYAEPRFTIVKHPSISGASQPELEEKKIERPFYYLAISEPRFLRHLSECQVIHQVKRQGVPLSIIKKCD